MTDEQFDATVTSRGQASGQGNLMERFMPSLAY
jgi:hypothetical protein